MKYHLIFPFLTLCLSSAFGQISIGPSREVTNYSSSPKDTTIVDLDLDGDLDIIFREQYFGWVRWYLNDGSGNFSRGGEWLPSIDRNQDYWSSLGFFDYDGDGYLDILGLLKVGHEDTQSICLVRGLEGATFEENFTEILVRKYDRRDDELDPLTFPLQDFDGDGRKDILFRNHIIFLKSAPLTVTETNVVINNGDIEQPFVDWNNDGLPDIIGGFLTPQGFGIRLNQGQGHFSKAQTINLPALYQKELRRADIDLIRRPSGAGALEFCLSYEVDDVDYLSILTKNSDGSAFISATSKKDDLLPPGLFGDWNYGVRGERVIIEAYKRLGYPPEVDAYEMIWDGSQLSAEPLITGISAWTFGGEEVASGDLDGDGTSDLIVTTNGPDNMQEGATDEIFWLRGSVGGSYNSVRNSIVDPSFMQSLLAALDVDLDGLPDLLTLERRRNSLQPGSLVLWKNSNDGETFQRLFLPGENTILSVLGNFEVDGSLSQLGGEFANIDWLLGGRGRIVSRNVSPELRDFNVTLEISYLAQDSSNDFVLLDYMNIEVADRDKVYFEDLNGDGIEDLAYSQYFIAPGGNSLRNAIFVNYGKPQAGGFEAAVLILENASFEGPPTDLDKDGDLDLYILGRSPDGLSGAIWVENQSGEFIAGHEFSEDIPRYYWNADPITRLDLDGDGDLDQVSGMPTNRIRGWSRVGWFENKEGTEQVDAELSQLISFTKTRWALRDSHLLADLDNDGIKDLVVGSSSNSRLEWFKITHATQPQNYITWATSKGVTGHSSSPLADWDGDSWTNWEEFAFGSDPNRVDQNHPGRPKVIVNSGGPTLTFNKRLDAGNDEIIYQHFQSPNLQSWSSWLPEEAIHTPIDEDYEKVSIPLTLPRAFFRVQPMLPSEE